VGFALASIVSLCICLYSFWNYLNYTCLLLMHCFLSFSHFPPFYFIYNWITQALSTRIEPGLEQEIVLPRDSYLQVYILALTHIFMFLFNFYPCACVQTIYIYISFCRVISIMFQNISELDLLCILLWKTITTGILVLSCYVRHPPFCIEN